MTLETKNVLGEMDAKIFQLVLEATTVQQVTSIFKGIGSKKYEFKPVGDRPNNLATINISTDPAGGITERITNAIDAVLERAFHENGEPSDIISPRSASEAWFDVPRGKLNQIENARDPRIKNLSDKIRVSLLSSKDRSKPTIEIRDKGIGLKSSDFAKTVLSLNGANKIGKRYLMGAFGQGGSTALSFNDYTIIISKPVIGTDQDKRTVSWTIVRINPGDVNLHKHEWYEYVVDKKTGLPFTVELDDSKFEPGTLIRHIRMDLGKYSGSMTAPGRGLWYVTHNYLFDPIIPFTIADRRSGKTDNRTVTGNSRLLSTTDNLEYQQRIPLTFRDGKISIYYWVLNNTGSSPKDRIKHYVMPSKPVIITFNGQKQGVLGNGLIKKDLKLPFLDRYLIIQIEADEMDNESKRQLFSTTRESLRETSILEELETLTIETLSDDQELQRLNKERKQRYFTKNDSDVLDNLKKRLARRINSFLKSSGQGGSTIVKPASGSGEDNSLPEIPILDPPSFFTITTKAPKEVYINKTFSIKFETDAHPNYFARPETFAAYVSPQSFGSFIGAPRVYGGRGLAYFKVDESVKVGDSAEISMELRPAMARSLTANIKSVAVESPEKGDNTKGGGNKSPNIQVDFLYSDSAYYMDNEWNETTVAEVLNDQEGVVIYVSAENKNLDKLVVRAQRKSPEAVDNIKNKYLEHISFYAFMIHQERVKMKDLDEESVDNTITKSLESASETVTGMLFDFFDVIVTESVGDDE